MVMGFSFTILLSYYFRTSKFGGHYMWLKIDLDGINFQLEITNYTQLEDRSDYPEEWCNVSMKYQSGEWLDYVVDRQQLLLSDEVDDLQSALSRFLNDEFMNAEVLGFAEPDIEFILYPKRDVRADPNLLYISPDADPILDILMDLRVSFWNGGLTANYLSLCMDREDIEMLHKYLMLVTEKMDVDSKDIQKMISGRYLFI